MGNVTAGALCCAADGDGLTADEIFNGKDEAGPFACIPRAALDEELRSKSCFCPRNVQQCATALRPRPRTLVDMDAFYTGQWLGEKRHGYGQIEKKGIGVYDGEFANDRAMGEGRFVKLNGDVYEGQWLDDKANGQGTYLHADGSSYQGEWQEDLKHGRGIETWLDGSTFEGTYRDGKKHGQGVYQAADASTYEGQFRNDKMEGTGRYVFADGRIYVGQWFLSRMSGEGRMLWTDGRHYQGQYVDDKKSGQGRFTWADGRTYDGDWYKGKQHGHGTYTDPRGRSWTGEWNNGQKMSNRSSHSGSEKMIRDSSESGMSDLPARSPSKYGASPASSSAELASGLDQPLISPRSKLSDLPDETDSFDRHDLRRASSPGFPVRSQHSHQRGASDKK
mmetsp:Transcript_19648/g.52397  ORF Transcript_19648/g.52397 Transcript_19648/m.52397 type:complete len:392 (-) Transcript_19648:674-1849(-)